jgi:uncharacterized membrane protein
MGFMWIWWLLAIGLGMVAVMLFGRWNRDPHTHPSTPEEILKRRFAQGEIEKTEYEQKLAELRK